MTDLSNRLKITAMVPTAGDNHGALNRNLTLLEAGAVLDIIATTNDPSALTPAAGDTHIVGSSPVGDFSGQAGKIAVYRNGWYFVDPLNGLCGIRQDKDDTQWAYSEAESDWFPVQEYWSTTEHWTGRYGKGGSKIYAKCLEGISVAAGGTLVNTAHGITNLDLNKPVKLQGYLHDGTTVYQLSMALSGSIRVYHNIDGTNYVVNPDNLPTAFTCDVRIEYCKTA